MLDFGDKHRCLLNSRIVIYSKAVNRETALANSLLEIFKTAGVDAAKHLRRGRVKPEIGANRDALQVEFHVSQRNISHGNDKAVCMGSSRLVESHRSTQSRLKGETLAPINVAFDKSFKLPIHPASDFEGDVAVRTTI